MPAPITTPERALLSAVIFNSPFMLLNVKLTPQLDLGSAKTDHCQFQIRPLGVETGQYPTQKPLALLRRIIETFSDKDDVVLDPCGSIARHSSSVTSVWYRLALRLCFLRVVGVHMATPGLV